MQNIQFWITLVPLVTIAGSAVAYVIKIYQDASVRRRTQFFELMQYIDGQGTAATKMAAIYQLRDFPEHKDFVVRFCTVQAQNISSSGVSARILIDEMNATREAMERL